jgi:hypothetical protein
MDLKYNSLTLKLKKLPTNALHKFLRTPLMLHHAIEKYLTTPALASSGARRHHHNFPGAVGRPSNLQQVHAH